MARRTHLPMPSTQRENTLCGAGLHHESEGTPPPLIAESMQGADCQRCLKMIEAPFYRERVQRHFNDSSVQPAKPPATRVSVKRRWVKWVAALIGGLLVIMVVIAIVAPPADDEQAAAAAPQQQAVGQAQEQAAAHQQQAVEQAQEQAAAHQQQAVGQAQEQAAAPETDAEIAARCLSPWGRQSRGLRGSDPSVAERPRQHDHARHPLRPQPERALRASDGLRRPQRGRRDGPHRGRGDDGRGELRDRPGDRVRLVAARQSDRVRQSGAAL